MALSGELPVAGRKKKQATAARTQASQTKTSVRMPRLWVLDRAGVAGLGVAIWGEGRLKRASHQVQVCEGSSCLGG